MRVTIDDGGLRHTSSLCQQISSNLNAENQQLAAAQTQLQGSVQGLPLQVESQLTEICNSIMSIEQQLQEVSAYLSTVAGQYNQLDQQFSGFRAD